MQMRRDRHVPQYSYLNFLLYSDYKSELLQQCVVNPSGQVGDQMSFRVMTSNNDINDTGTYSGFVTGVCCAFGKMYCLTLGQYILESIKWLMRNKRYDKLCFNRFLNLLFTLQSMASSMQFARRSADNQIPYREPSSVEIAFKRLTNISQRHMAWKDDHRSNLVWISIILLIFLAVFLTLLNF